MQFLPVVALTLVGGAVADAYDRRRIMRLAQIPYLASAALLFAATARGAISVPLLYAAVFINAVTFAFESPARQAFLAEPRAARRLPARGHATRRRRWRSRSRPALRSAAC